MGKKKVIGETNPFAFSPCEFNQFIYDWREPFVDVIRGQFDRVVDNKFAGGKMPKATLDKIMAEYAGHYTFAEKLFSCDSLGDDNMTEGNLRPIHVMPLGLPGMFARPTDREWREYENNNPSWMKKALKKFINWSVGTPSSPESLNQGFALARYISGDQTLGDDPPSSSDDTEYKGSAVDEHGAHNFYQEDVLLYTENKVDCELVKRDSNPHPPKMLAGAAECKDDANCNVKGIFQAAGCARAGVIRNVENGHGLPVYLLCPGMTKWFYGVLVVEGTIQVCVAKEGNYIRETDYEDYVASCAVTKAARVLSYDEPNSKLETGHRKLLQSCSDENCNFPMQKYVVGRLHVPEGNSCALKLPRCSEAGAFNTPDARVFVEGLMRLIIGDGVLKWTPDKVKVAKLIREAMNHDASSKGGAEPADTMREFWWCVEASAQQRVESLPWVSAALANALRQVERLSPLLPPEKAKILLDLSQKGTQVLRSSEQDNSGSMQLTSARSVSSNESLTMVGTSETVTEVKAEVKGEAAEIKTEKVEQPQAKGKGIKRRTPEQPAVKPRTRRAVQMAASSAEQ